MSGSQRKLESQLNETFAAHIATLCERTSKALAACGYEGLLVYSGTLLPVFEDDRTYPYETNAPFKVWVPLQDAPGSFVWFAPGATPRLIVERPQDYWYKPAEVPSGYWVRHFDVHAVPDLAAARALLPRDLSKAAYIGDAFADLASFGVGAVNPAPLIRRLDYARAAKTPYELECLREANRLGARGHRAAADAFHAGASEFEIELAFLKACGLREQELPYNPIIALNSGGAVLHYQVLEKQAPAQRLSMLIDAGAESGGYASDITRTYSRRGCGFPRSHRKNGPHAAGAVRRGPGGRRLARHPPLGAPADRRGPAGGGPHPLQRSRGGRGGHYERLPAARHRAPLGTGSPRCRGLHALARGRGYPEAARSPLPAPDPQLEEGFVVTMEPGIYFIPQLLEAARADARGRQINWSRVEALSRFGGIRIEDDLAVTREGCENLTRDAFASEQ